MSFSKRNNHNCSWHAYFKEPSASLNLAEGFIKNFGFLQRILLKFVSTSAHKYLPFGISYLTQTSDIYFFAGQIFFNSVVKIQFFR